MKATLCNNNNKKQNAMVINSLVPSLSFSPVSESHVTTGWMSLTKLREKEHELLDGNNFTR